MHKSKKAKISLEFQEKLFEKIVDLIIASSVVFSHLSNNVKMNNLCWRFIILTKTQDNVLHTS